MLKLLYRGIILLAVFAGSLVYFGQDMKEEVFDIQKTIEMSDTTFPIITLRLGEEDINLLHGYSSNLDANLVRESTTPLDDEKSLEVVIDGKGNDVKRLIYELRSVTDNKLLETDTINALEKEDTNKTAKIKIKTELTPNQEYALKITLVTSESRKMNYYTRIKQLASSNYKEKLDFVMDFHNSIMDKSKAENIIKYLEPESDADNTSLSNVNIHSSFDLVSWGNLKPEVLGNLTPTIKDINDDTASIQLKYMISAKTESGTENYFVKEYYRVRYTQSRMYLLNYERSMESVFDINLTSLKKSELKIGITGEQDIDLVTDKNNTKLAFVRQRELWYYNLTENSAVKVFSFRQDNTDYVRDTYDEHDVRILNMDDDGNISFMVYGYMNRGVYEGRVGIVLYKYYSGDNRIEELLYIPMNVTYQVLKEQLDSFSYLNEKDIFYFSLNNKIYSYNLITKELVTIAKDVNEENFVVSKEGHYIAWQNNTEAAKSTEIILLDLESGEKKSLTSTNKENILLLGKIDNNIIYGYVKTKDITTRIDGSILVPMYKIVISDAASNILKEYQENKYYVSGITVEQNIITLERVKKGSGSQFNSADQDYILNKITEETKPIGLTTRVTEKTLTEVYVSLPSGFTMGTKPSLNKTINTIITEDTTLRIDEELKSQPYIVYALGDVEGLYDNAGEAINHADVYAGTVLDSEQQIVWERTIKSSLKELNVTPIYTSGSTDSIKACVRMLLSYRNGSNYSGNIKSGTVFEMLNSSIGAPVINLTGCNLDEVLYYVNQNIPVIAMKDEDDAVLIVGYDTYNITVIDPDAHMKKKIGLNDGTELFKEAGNLFFSYLANK